jgi:hypothetical protein
LTHSLDEAGDVGLGDVAEAGPAGRREERQVAHEVAAVGGDGVGREAALHAQVREVVLQGAVEPGADVRTRRGLTEGLQGGLGG